MKLLIISILFIITVSVAYGHEKVRLSDITALTLNYGLMTNGRRSQPVPQLECVGGSANCKEKYLPRVVQCKNMGSDGYDVQWKCKADLLANIKFGKVDVNCEGYDYPNDKFVLKGSCGLRYTLDISGNGEKSYTYESKTKDSNNAFYFIVIGVVACMLIYFFCLSSNGAASDTASTAPPPPGFRPEYTDDSTGFRSGYGAPPPYESVHRPKQNFSTGGDGPGFWTGLGAGGLMGYMFGSSGSRQRTPYYNSGADFSQPDSTWRSASPGAHRDSSDRSEFRSASGYGGTSRR